MFYLTQGNTSSPVEKSAECVFCCKIREICSIPTGGKYSVLKMKKTPFWLQILMFKMCHSAGSRIVYSGSAGTRKITHEYCTLRCNNCGISFLAVYAVFL